MDMLLSVSSTRNTFLTLLSEAQESTYRMWAGRTTETFFLDPLICSERASGCAESAIAEKEPQYKEDINQGRVGEIRQNCHCISRNIALKRAGHGSFEPFLRRKDSISSRETNYRALMYGVYPLQKCNFHLIPITSKS